MLSCMYQVVGCQAKQSGIVAKCHLEAESRQLDPPLGISTFDAACSYACSYASNHLFTSGEIIKGLTSVKDSPAGAEGFYQQ